MREIKSLNALDPERIYTVPELLNYIPISKSKLYKLLKEAKVPAIPGVGRRNLYLGKHILKFLMN